MGRAPCCDKANVKKGPWSPEEDAKLKAYIDQYGTGGNWIALPQKIGLKRCGKSCRLRWLNYLRPNIKHGAFTEEEDNIICSLYISIGSRWSIIAAQLPGRTDNDIKNYWNTKLKKKLLGRRKKSVVNPVQDPTQDPKDTNRQDDNSSSPVLSNSAIERIQLHMQLQNFQNPMAFYNNPSLWPKMHPLQEKMIQNLQLLNESTSSFIQYPTPNIMLQGQGYSEISNLRIDELKNSINRTTYLDSSLGFNNGNTQLDSIVVTTSSGIEQIHEGGEPNLSFQTEIEDFLDNKMLNCPTQHGQVSEFDSFMEGSKDGLVYWTNDFDAKSASSNSWDSTHVFQAEGMYQDYGICYNMD